MTRDDLGDTIAAIATSLGESGIGIVRVSGKDALAIADKIFVSKDKQKPTAFKTYTIHYGWIIDRHASCVMRHASKGKNAQRTTHSAQRNIIDEVILTVMRSPRSYTKEDIIEINCHGGIVALKAVLELVLAHGARLAQPGEFTKRAFLNGRIDLSQAEAVLDIIRAKTGAALKLGLSQLQGGLSRRINKIREGLLEIAAVLEANIEFPDEEIGGVDRKEISGRLCSIRDELKKILSSARQGRIMREGLCVVICGKPNVGKSSLLNALLKYERSIVTAVAGTTRDTIEEIIDIKGIPVRIVDTAGIMEPNDLIGKKAVARSKRHIEEADLVLLVFDASKRLSKEDTLLIKRLTAKTVIAVVNKIDIRQRIERAKINKVFNDVVMLSAKKLQNIDLLEDAIAGLVYAGNVPISEPPLVSNLRHTEIIRSAEKLIAQAQDSLDNELSVEFVAQDIKEALNCLDDILGKKFTEDILDRIFNEFCVGK